MFKIAAFPKCYLKDITEGKISLFDWIEMAEDLEVEGLEFYSRFLTSLDTHYLQKIKDALKLRGFQMPMMCHSPDFTHPDAKERRMKVVKKISRRSEVQQKIYRIHCGGCIVSDPFGPKREFFCYDF